MVMPHEKIAMANLNRSREVRDVDFARSKFIQIFFLGAPARKIVGICEKYNARRPRLDDFSDMISPAEISFMEKRLKKKQAAIEKNRQKELAENTRTETEQKESKTVGDFAEYIIMHALDQGILTCEEIHALPGSLYDDWFNGIDIIVPLYDNATGKLIDEFSIDIKTNPLNVDKAAEIIKEKIQKKQLVGGVLYQYPQDIGESVGPKNPLVKKINFQMPNIALYFPVDDLKTLTLYLAEMRLPKDFPKTIKKDQDVLIFNVLRGKFIVGIIDFCDNILKEIEIIKLAADFSRRFSEAEKKNLLELESRYRKIQEWAQSYLTGSILNADSRYQVINQ